MQSPVPSLNDQVIWEDLITPGPQQPAAGRRVFADGRFEEYSDKKLHIDPKSMRMRAEPRPLGWYPLTTLSAKKVQRLRTLIEMEGFFNLPAEIDLPNKTFDTTTWLVRARLGDREHTVRVLKYPANLPATLKRLLDGVVALTAN